MSRFSRWRETGLAVSMRGLFVTCSFVIDTGSACFAQSGWPVAIGAICTLRFESQPPASTAK